MKALTIALFVAFSICAVFTEAAQRGEWDPDKAERPTVKLVELDDGVYEVTAEFFAEVDKQLAWQVLSDYDHLGEFVSSVIESRVLQKSECGLLVRQKALGKFIVFSEELDTILSIVETPGKRIEFIDLDHQDFYFYRGSWSLEKAENGVKVIYQVQAKQKRRAPGMVIRHLAKTLAVQLLIEVRTEMNRRAELGTGELKKVPGRLEREH